MNKENVLDHIPNVNTVGDYPLRCGMMDPPDPESELDDPCSKPARRHIRGQPGVGCCDDCFNEMMICGDFTAEELDAEYPLIEDDHGKMWMR